MRVEIATFAIEPVKRIGRETVSESTQAQHRRGRLCNNRYNLLLPEPVVAPATCIYTPKATIANEQTQGPEHAETHA